jgi:hypothetical protein
VLAAIEALAKGDPHTACRALEGEAQKTALGQRLELLAKASGFDLDSAKAMAHELLDRPPADPGLLLDAEAAAALPPSLPLPREVLVERLLDLLPSAVRVVAAEWS